MNTDLSRRNLFRLTNGLALGAVAYSAGRPALTSRAPRHWQAEILHYDDRGRLRYVTDAEQNRVPDFSYAGYRNGMESIPDVPTVLTISPVEGDNTAHIQAALDQVGSLPRDDMGLRGAVLLSAGVYSVAGSITIGHSGVVLRGVGDGRDPESNTIIRAVGNQPANRSVLIVGVSGRDPRWAAEVPGTRTEVLSGFLAVGDRRLVVKDAGNLVPGSHVIIQHPVTERWLEAVNYGDTAGGPPWDDTVALPITYHRYVEDIRGRQVTLDVPLFNHLDRRLSQSYLYQRDDAPETTQVGVERLRVDIEYHGDPDEDEDHANKGLTLQHSRDVWVLGCTFLHFRFAGVSTVQTTRATIADCRAIDPVSLIEGGRRYNFASEADSQQILYTNCYARGARHAYVSNGRACDSNIVYHRCVAEGSYTASEGHRLWSHGLLYDHHLEIDPVADLTVAMHNRGNWGSASQAHGWGSAHSVAWNTDTAGTELLVQKPPTAQNYAIGCFGDVTGDGPFLTGTEVHGYMEGSNEAGLYPESLYEAQLADRSV